MQIFETIEYFRIEIRNLVEGVQILIYLPRRKLIIYIINSRYKYHTGTDKNRFLYRANFLTFRITGSKKSVFILGGSYIGIRLQ